jgi:hypothetical protein
MVIAIFCALWTNKGGDSGNTGGEHPGLTRQVTALRRGMEGAENVISGKDRGKTGKD